MINSVEETLKVLQNKSVINSSYYWIKILDELIINMAGKIN